MRVLLGLLVLLLATSIAPARGDGIGPPISELLNLDVSRATYPNEDAVILYWGIEIEADAEGRVTHRIRRVQRLLTDLAIDHRGDERVAYDTTRQELTINRCRTFMLDGTEVPALPRAFNRVTPDRVASCPDRTGLQEMVISHLGVERGCLIELDYTLGDRIPWRPWLEGIENLGDEAAVLRGEVQIRTSGSLLAKVVGSPSNLESAGESGRWTYGPMPGIPDEGGLSDRERIPFLIYSTCPSWEELGRVLRGRLEEASVPDEAIRAWADGPLESGRRPLNDEERFARIGRLIADRTHPADDAPLAWWLPVRPAARTFETSCGNLLDRAALASAILRVLEIPVRPALLPVTPELVREVPALAQCADLWWVAAGRSLSTSEGAVAAAPDPGRAEEMLLLGTPGAEAVPLASRVARSSLAIRVVEEADGSVRGEAALRLGGGVCTKLDYQDLDSFLDRLADELVTDGGVAGYVVEALGDDTLAVTMSWTGSGLGEKAGEGRRRWTIPSVPGIPGLLLPGDDVLRRRNRRTDLPLPYSIAETVDLRLELPAGTRVLILPRTERLESGGTLLETSVERSNDAWHLRRRFVSSRRSIAPEDYPAIRDLFLRRLEGGSNDIYLTGGGGGE